jgi:hypothetical protein
MEPLVHTISCPNCAEAMLAFKSGAVTTCEACSFHAEVFSDRAAAFDRFEGFLSDSDVIVADPVRMGTTRWVVAHTRMLLV